VYSNDFTADLGLHIDKDYVLYYINNFMGWNIINERKLDIKRITTDYWTIELKGIHFI
jgi:hypothetical protein